MKALEKDRRRRYETASGFAADVRRYLADEPVEACPPSALYRLGKLARRHRALLTTSGLIALALVVGVATSLLQAARATQAAKESAQRSEESRQVVQYIVDHVLGAGGPARADGRTPTIVVVLESADVTLSRTFAGQPLVEAPVRMARGRAYDHLAEYAKSGVEYERAADLYLRHLGPDHPDTLSALSECVDILANQGRKDEVVALGRSILAARRRLLGTDHPDTIFSLAKLGYRMGLWAEHLDEGIRLGTEAVGRAERALGPGHPLTWETLDCLGVNLERHGDLARAERMLRQAVAGYESTVGIYEWNTFWAYKHLSEILEARGRIAEARQVAVDSLERISRGYGLVHGQTRNRMYEAVRLLRLERNATGLRDFSESWIRRLFDSPEDTGHWALECRAAMLRTLSLSLATLSQPVPYDASLALRAAEEAAALDPQSHAAWTTLAIVLTRLDRFEPARETLRNAQRRTAGKEGDGYLRFAESLICLGLNDRNGAHEAFDHAVAAQAEAQRQALHYDLYPEILLDLRREVSIRLGLDPEAGRKPAVSPCDSTK
jgi:tetratricopeptide (TPR) repeat protein